ncbi:conserved exported hypothetical protein [Luteimonas sp. 9C]|uniref:hypothetical protein n=1 Tax=Luteimonas sp. 9C TaxID=2653148 RepID=UPI0012F2F9AA|nr:hypothetical protein [Luteimonas sp. 9C]VXB10276.1 conserved exported hypothetical protein [Luteimonas sp. 9C]
MRHPIQTGLYLLLPCLTLATGIAEAAGARAGVQPTHGEMVLLRDVSARHAVRQAPPGIGLIVDPTPNRQLMPSLPGGELSDADFLALDTGQQVQGAMRGTGGIAAPVTQVLTGTLGGGATARDASGIQGAGTLGAATGGPLGAVGSATRGIGGHITGALSQMPFTQPANGGGP